MLGGNGEGCGFVPRAGGDIFLSRQIMNLTRRLADYAIRPSTGSRDFEPFKSGGFDKR